jgi:hypothetical protein
MLSVRIIYPDGSELVKEVSRVFKVPSETDTKTTSCVHYYEPNSVTCNYVDSGNVYVMNDNGKTIATYTVNTTVAK